MKNATYCNLYAVAFFVLRFDLKCFVIFFHMSPYHAEKMTGSNATKHL